MVTEGHMGGNSCGQFEGTTVTCLEGLPEGQPDSGLYWNCV